jgi:hypothetical protein
LLHSSIEEGSEDQLQKAGPENTPKPPPFYTNDVKNISPLIQLVEQVAKQQYDIKALTHNLVEVQPTTSKSYRTIIKALAAKRTEFHTYKLKEERSFRVVLKNICTNPSTLKKSRLNLRNKGTRSQISGILYNTELSYYSSCFL